METTIKLKHFLKNKKVKLVAVPNKAKWAGILVNEGAGLSDKEPHMLEKVKRTYTLPVILTSGQKVRILDNIDKYFTPQFPNESLTEEEFFERLLGIADLSPLALFWRQHGNNPLSKVVTKKGGLTFDMANAADVLKIKILKANIDLIAPSWEERNNKASYEFALVDEEIIATNKAEERKIKDAAFEIYMKLKQSKKTMADYLKVAGKPLRGDLDAFTEEFLQNELADIRDLNVKEFIAIYNDSSFEEKVLINDAIQVGAIKKEGKSTYALPSGAIIAESDKDLIFYLRNPQHLEVRKRIEFQIENDGMTPDEKFAQRKTDTAKDTK